MAAPLAAPGPEAGGGDIPGPQASSGAGGSSLSAATLARAFDNTPLSAQQPPPRAAVGHGSCACAASTASAGDRSTARMATVRARWLSLHLDVQRRGGQVLLPDVRAWSAVCQELPLDPLPNAEGPPGTGRRGWPRRDAHHQRGSSPAAAMPVRGYALLRMRRFHRGG